MSSDVSTNIDKFVQTGLAQYIQEGLKKAGAIVANEATRLCPKDTGQLRRSIDFKVDEESVVIFSNVEYAPYVEIGTGIYSSKGNGRKKSWRYKGKDGWVTTKGNEPQPFLEPAAINSKSDIQDCFKGLI